MAPCRATSANSSNARSWVSSVEASPKHPANWAHETDTLLVSARAAQTYSNIHHERSSRAAVAAQEENRKQEESVRNALMKKVSQSTGLVNALKEQIRSVKEAVSLSHASRAELQEAHFATRAPMELNTWRKERRAHRPERELKRDNMEIALEQEQQTLKDSRKRLEHSSESVRVMIESLERTLKELEADLQAKKHALDLDDACIKEDRRFGHGSPQSTGQSTRMSAAGNATISFPRKGRVSMDHEDREEHRHFDTRVSIQKARKREQAAQALRDECAYVMKATNAACRSAGANVQKRLQESINELQSKRKQLQQALEKTYHKVGLTSCTLHNTATEIGQHNPPFDLSATRHKLREQRPQRENIEDPVSKVMEEQVAKLQKNIGGLARRHEAEKSVLDRLHQERVLLEADLDDKAKALFIDVECQKKTLEDANSYQPPEAAKRSIKINLARLGVKCQPGESHLCSSSARQSVPRSAAYMTSNNPAYRPTLGLSFSAR